MTNNQKYLLAGTALAIIALYNYTPVFFGNPTRFTQWLNKPTVKQPTK